ncbi:MAG: histidinol-phosphatase HisJ family protein [Lachnospiraceae bacterium]|nr:histidinol-phosphatase HisJ family protein [Lachnospiraceae bacterium]
MFADYHVHTEFSNDSVYPIQEVIEDAIAMRMDEICFTDHVDYGVKKDRSPLLSAKEQKDKQYLNVDYPAYAAKIKELRLAYGSRIDIRMGLEFGMQSHTVRQFEKLLHSVPFDRNPLDFIILSVHQVEDKEFWTQEFQEGKSQREYNERYYQELLHVVREYKDYSVLGHLDLISRYDRKGLYPLEQVKPIISEILKTAIRDGKGLELNTSCRRYGLKDTTPAVEILKLYRELGGEIITVGSDSHQPGQLGAFIEEGKQLLKSLGFCYFNTYDEMVPIYHKL